MNKILITEVPETQLWEGDVVFYDSPRIGKIHVVAGFMEAFGHILNQNNLYAIYQDSLVNNPFLSQTIISNDPQISTILPGGFNILGINYVSNDNIIRSWYRSKIVDIGINERRAQCIKTIANFPFVFNGRNYELHVDYCQIRNISVKVDDMINVGDRLGIQSGKSLGLEPHVNFRTYIIDDDGSLTGFPGETVYVSPNLIETEINLNDIRPVVEINTNEIVTLSLPELQPHLYVNDEGKKSVLNFRLVDRQFFPTDIKNQIPNIMENLPHETRDLLANNTNLVQLQRNWEDTKTSPNPIAAQVNFFQEMASEGPCSGIPPILQTAIELVNSVVSQSQGAQTFTAGSASTDQNSQQFKGLDTSAMRFWYEKYETAHPIVKQYLKNQGNEYYSEISDRIGTFYFFTPDTKDLPLNQWSGSNSQLESPQSATPGVEYNKPRNYDQSTRTRLLPEIAAMQDRMIGMLAAKEGSNSDRDIFGSEAPDTHLEPAGSPREGLNPEAHGMQTKSDEENSKTQAKAALSILSELLNIFCDLMRLLDAFTPLLGENKTEEKKVKVQIEGEEATIDRLGNKDYTETHMARTSMEVLDDACGCDAESAGDC